MKKWERLAERWRKEDVKDAALGENAANILVQFITLNNQRINVSEKFLAETTASGIVNRAIELVDLNEITISLLNKLKIFFEGTYLRLKDEGKSRKVDLLMNLLPLLLKHIDDLENSRKRQDFFLQRIVGHLNKVGSKGVVSLGYKLNFKLLEKQIKKEYEIIVGINNAYVKNRTLIEKVFPDLRLQMSVNRFLWPSIKLAVAAPGGFYILPILLIFYLAHKYTPHYRRVQRAFSA